VRSPTWRLSLCVRHRAGDRRQRDRHGYGGSDRGGRGGEFSLGSAAVVWCRAPCWASGRQLVTREALRTTVAPEWRTRPCGRRRGASGSMSDATPANEAQPPWLWRVGREGRGHESASGWAAAVWCLVPCCASCRQLAASAAIRIAAVLASRNRPCGRRRGGAACVCAAAAATASRQPRWTSHGKRGGGGGGSLRDAWRPPSEAASVASRAAASRLRGRPAAWLFSFDAAPPLVRSSPRHLRVCACRRGGVRITATSMALEKWMGTSR